MLLVDDDEARPGQGREDRRARADEDPRRAGGRGPEGGEGPLISGCTMSSAPGTWGNWHLTCCL